MEWETTKKEVEADFVTKLVVSSLSELYFPFSQILVLLFQSIISLTVPECLRFTGKSKIDSFF